uniref:Pre-rRNA-processing protein Ipi1 N-terminal domain-containing protein n=1 Tax=Acrobeloides nanus TaxID=290746 RepID=A0A914EGL5_9BILA
MSKKKSKAKNEDFKKQKLKPGKVLKKTNVTDTRMSVKKVVLIEQLKDKASPVTTVRGLTLEDLCKQLGHYSQNVRRDAIAGIYQLISSHNELLNKYLRFIVPSVARLIGEETNDNTTRNHLKNLLEVICKVDEIIMESHFPILLVHILRALTHMQMAVRVFALKILILVMKNYGQLCLKNVDLFDVFLQLMSGQRRPRDKTLVLEAWKYFLAAYSKNGISKNHQCATDVISFSERTSQVDLSIHFSTMDFSILGPSAQVQESPLDSEARLVNCCNVMCPLLARLISEEENPDLILPDCILLIQQLIDAIQRFCELNALDSFKSQILKAFEPLTGLSKLPTNKKLLKCLKHLDF